jgi:hypothetical protein
LAPADLLSLLVFSPFIVDATVTICGAASRRAHLARASAHYYQRLVLDGWTRRQLA